MGPFPIKRHNGGGKKRGLAIRTYWERKIKKEFTDEWAGKKDFGKKKIPTRTSEENLWKEKIRTEQKRLGRGQRGNQAYTERGPTRTTEEGEVRKECNR